MRDPQRRSGPAQLVEAVLLVSASPIRSSDLRSATRLSDQELEEALAGLRERYAPETSGIVLREVASGFLLSTNPACSGFRQETRPTPLSGAAHEVLACALYLGPLTRGAVSRARGVNSDAVVRSLIERGLIVEVGSDHDAPGSPALLGVTDEFLAATGASSRKDFPPVDSLVTQEELTRVRERLVSGAAPPHPDSEPS